MDGIGREPEESVSVFGGFVLGAPLNGLILSAHELLMTVPFCSDIDFHSPQTVAFLIGRDLCAGR